MKQFDYIIAGGGAAGLTLAFLLMGNKNTKKTTLILDKSPKAVNDRTWCFWEKGDNLLENLVYKSWDQAHFESDDYRQTFNIAPYQYKMIRGLDFYNFMRNELAQHPEISWVQEEIKQISPEGIVTTSDNSYEGKLVFDSTKPLSYFEDHKAHTNLIQHFKGYFLKTQKPIFQADTISYMDFRTPQQGDFRFGYVLPLSATEALVEYTIFSTELLKAEAYTEGLENYLRDVWKVTEYEVTEEEYGIIPMTDYPFTQKVSERVMRIGISGGFAKPSTGYTFLRGQKILQQMVLNLSQGSPVDQKLPYQKKRFKKYDSTLLKVLAKPDNVGKQAFTDMFRKNGMQRMFRFLDEETSIAEELAVMSSTPLITFGKAFFQGKAKG